MRKVQNKAYSPVYAQGRAVAQHTIEMYAYRTVFGSFLWRSCVACERRTSVIRRSKWSPIVGLCMSENWTEIQRRSAELHGRDFTILYQKTQCAELQGRDLTILNHPRKVVTEHSCAEEWFCRANNTAKKNHSSAHECSVTTFLG